MGVFKKTFVEVLIVIVILILVAVVGGIFLDEEEIKEDESLLRVRINDTELFLEVADNSFLQTIGLSGRETLQQNHGMIFVYDEEIEDLTFWMKNTFIPLDMIFLNSNLEIVYIIENVPICEKDPCATYTSQQKAQYVIEVNASWVEENNVVVGDRVETTNEILFDS